MSGRCCTGRRGSVSSIGFATSTYLYVYGIRNVQCWMLGSFVKQIMEHEGVASCYI